MVKDKTKTFPKKPHELEELRLDELPEITIEPPPE